MNAPANANPSSANPAAQAAANPKRRQALTAIAVAVLAVGAAYGGWYWINGRHYESTDNAYVQANVVQITAQAGGTVLAINADDTDFVKAGQPLVRLDPADARVALDQAEAQLAQTVRDTRVLFANNATLQAQIDARQADVTRIGADLARAQDDVDRRAPLVKSGAVGKEEFDHVNAQLTAVKGEYSAAKSALVAALGAALVTERVQAVFVSRLAELLTDHRVCRVPSFPPTPCFLSCFRTSCRTTTWTCSLCESTRTRRSPSPMPGSTPRCPARVVVLVCDAYLTCVAQTLRGKICNA